MSSNSTASPGAGRACCKPTTLLAAAVTSIVLCFVLVVAFLFLRFLLHRRRWRRSSARLLLLQQQQQYRSKLGLDAAAIALIPAFPYRRGAGAGDAARSASGPAECAVCLSVMEEGQMARELPSCRHVFHRDCIDVWLASRASCPVCRRKAEPPVPAEERAASAAPAPASARVVAIEMFDDEVLASSSTPGEAERPPWTRPEAESASTT